MMIMMMVMAVQVTLLQRVYFGCEAALRERTTVYSRSARHISETPAGSLSRSISLCSPNYTRLGDQIVMLTIWFDYLFLDSGEPTDRQFNRACRHSN